MARRSPFHPDTSLWRRPSRVISQRRKGEREKKEKKRERGGRRGREREGKKHTLHFSGVESSAWGGNGVFTGRREGSSLVRRRRGWGKGVEGARFPPTLRAHTGVTVSYLATILPRGHFLTCASGSTLFSIEKKKRKGKKKFSPRFYFVDDLLRRSKEREGKRGRRRRGSEEIFCFPVLSSIPVYRLSVRKRGWIGIYERL